MELRPRFKAASCGADDALPASSCTSSSSERCRTLWLTPDLLTVARLCVRDSNVVLGRGASSMLALRFATGGRGPSHDGRLHQLLLLPRSVLKSSGSGVQLLTRMCMRAAYDMAGGRRAPEERAPMMGPPDGNGLLQVLGLPVTLATSSSEL